MVETAVFSIFHRAPPPQRDQVESVPVPAPPVVLAPAYEEPLVLAGLPPEPKPVSQDQFDVEPAAAQPIMLVADSVFAGEAFLSGVTPDHEMLGLANPEVFAVVASFDGQGAIDLTADPSGIYRPRNFRAAPWSGFAYDQAPDKLTGFAAGTRILTARGEIPVEGLLPGDSVMALRGPALLPITWVGRSEASEPVILIEQGALGPNRPRRPLTLAPDHPVFIDPMPVAARALVNGTTIRPTGAGQMELFHVDVGKADVLFAEGIPLSSGNRTGLSPG